MAIKPKSTSRENLSQDIKVFVFSTSLHIVNGFIVIGEQIKIFHLLR